MITATPTWSAVMRRLVDGADVSIDELFVAATLVSKADDRLAPSQWLSIAAELKRQTDAGPLDPSWRFVAWSIGAAADFVERLEAVTGEAVPWVK